MAIVAQCPWDTNPPAAREQARRIATQVQAREYLLWLLEMHPPNLSVAHGIAEMFWARDGVIIEEIVVGYVRWTLRLPAKKADNFKSAVGVIEAERALPKRLFERIERARDGRNRATHGRKAPPVAVDYRRLTPAGMRARLDPLLLGDLMSALSARLAASSS